MIESRLVSAALLMRLPRIQGGSGADFRVTQGHFGVVTSENEDTNSQG